MAKSTTNLFDVDMTKFTSALRMPKMDFQAAIAAQRKNVEALANANKTAFEGFQEIARRQSEIVTESVEELSGVVGELMSVSSMEDRTVKQAEIAKNVYQKALANFWDLGEIMTKSNSRAVGVINKRVAESLDEVKTIVGGPTAAA